MAFDLNGFFFDSFIRPVIDSSVQGYNLVNTLTYGAILLFAAFYIVYPPLNRRGLKFNEKFALSLIGFILIGTSLRTVNAFRLLPGLIEKTLNPFEPGFYTFTPGVWFLVFALVLAGFFIAERVSKNFYKAFAAVGLILSIPLLLFLFANYTNWEGFFLALASILLVGFAVKYALKELFRQKILENRLNFLAFKGQVIDSVASVIAINFYGFGEQHPLSNALITINPLLFVAVKIGLITAILYFIDREFDDENLKNFTKTFLFILGFATGLASLLKIGLV